MLQYQKLRKNRKRFLALSGLTPKEFKLLLPAYEQAYEQLYPRDKTLAAARASGR